MDKIAPDKSLPQTKNRGQRLTLTIIAGFVAPVVTGQLPTGWHALVTVAWIGLGVGIHLCAQLALGRLRQP